jgi:hypothetical protein
VCESGESRLWDAQKSVGLGRGSGEPIIFSAKSSQLKLERPYLGTQLGDLVEHAPVRRTPYVAEEGLGHIVSL